MVLEEEEGEEGEPISSLALEMWLGLPAIFFFLFFFFF
jgi:hypothetical protein